MLRIIVPIAIQWELKNGDAQIDRLRMRPQNDESGASSSDGVSGVTSSES